MSSTKAIEINKARPAFPVATSNRLGNNVILNSYYQNSIALKIKNRQKKKAAEKSNLISDLFNFSFPLSVKIIS